MNIEEIGTRLEIRDALARYCRGVDRGDTALILSAFHPDAIDDHGVWIGPATQFAEVITVHTRNATVASQHHITNVYMEIDGDVAMVESYYIAFHPVVDGKTISAPIEGELKIARQENHLLAGGRYLDRFERRDDAWKIARRQVTQDLSRYPLPGEPFKEAGNFPKVGCGKNDASNALFKK